MRYALLPALMEQRAALLEAIRELTLELDLPEAGLHCIAWVEVRMNRQEGPKTLWLKKRIP